MTTDAIAHKFLKKFKCLANDCPDICCYGWSIQIDDDTKKLYEEKAPILLENVIEIEGKNEIKKDSNGYCTKLKDKLCSIQSEYGANFLSDICYFYPRLIRKIGDINTVTASLSCPAIANIVIFDNQDFDFFDKELNRVPRYIKNLLPNNVKKEEFWNIHNLIKDNCFNNDNSSKMILDKLIPLSLNIGSIAQDEWFDYINFYMKNKVSTESSAKNDIDIYNLVNSILLLTKKNQKYKNPKLFEMILDIADQLNIEVDFATPSILINEPISYFEHKLDNLNSEILTHIEYVTKKFLIANLAISFFPWGGLGNNPAEKIMIITIKTMFLKLALSCYMIRNNNVLNNNEIVQIVQLISKLFDHLHDSNFLLIIMKEFDWDNLTNLTKLINMLK